MRIADNMNYTQVIGNLNKNRKEASDLQNQAATQKRVTKPSDDPAGTTRVLAARTDLTGIQQYEKSLAQARSFLEFSEQSLQELSEILMRLKELAIGQANEASANGDTRRSVSTEVEQLYQQAMHVANRKIGDRYLFGGYRTQAPPFSSNGEYRGDDGEMMIEVNKGAYIPMNIPGSKVFHGKGFAVRTLLDVNDGVPRSPADLAQLQARIEREHEDPAGEQQVPTKPVEGTPSEGGEKSSVPVRGPSSVEPQSVRSIVKADGENIFSVIRTLHAGLATDDTETIQSTLERIDEALNQVVMARSQLGSRVTTMNNTADSLTRGVLDSKTLVSSIEDANAFELFSEMNRNESTLKATLESSGRLIKPSLLDFLR